MRVKSLLGIAVALPILLGGSALRAQPYSNAVQTLSPVAYWPLTETTQPPSGQYIASNIGTAGAAGQGYYETWYQPYTVGSSNLFYQTNNILHIPGPIGDGDTAMVCNRNSSGIGQYVIFPRATNGVANPAVSLVPPFSIEFWVYPRSNVSSTMPIICQGHNAVLDPRNGYSTTNWAGFSIGQYGNIFHFVTWKPDDTSTKYEVDASITLSNWQHMVLTFDGTNQIWYKNGAKVATGVIPNSAANAYGQLYVPDAVSPLLVGTGYEPSAGNNGTEYAGVIDEVAIYTNLLDPTSISTHYANYSATDSSYKNAVLADNPSIYVRLGEPAFSASSYPSPATYPTAYNYGSLGAAADGLYQPGTTPGVAGPGYAGFGSASRAVAFNGHSGAVDVGGGSIPAELNPTNTASMSISAWFQANPADAPGRFQNIVGHGNSSWRIALDSTSGALRFNPGNGADRLQFTNTAEVISSNAVANDGKWHFVAGVYDGSTASLYLDGRLVKSASGWTNVAGQLNDCFLGGDPANTVPSYNTGNKLRYFDGQVAQVAFFTNALSASQIRGLYDVAGVPPAMLQQPQSFAGNSGANVTLSALAWGSGSLSYQWYKNNSPLSSATASTLTFNPVLQANSGTYFVVVTSDYGAVTSSVATLSVNGPPVLTQQSPTTVKVFSGATPVLRVTAAGPQPLSYQWSKDGSPISGATASAYTATAAGTYTCAITNIWSAGVPTSISPISVTYLTAPSAPYPSAVLADHPVNYYRLNENPDNYGGNNGTVAWDYAGGLNAVYTNAYIAQEGYDAYFLPQTETGDFGASFGSFQPVDSYAGNVSSYLTFAATNGSSSAFSVEAWARSSASPTTDAGLVTVGHGYGGEQFSLGVTKVSGKYVYRFYVNSTTNSASYSAASINANYTSDGIWHHLVGVCDQPNGKVYLYLDGALAASTSIPVNGGIRTNSMPLSIGSRLPSKQDTVYTNQFNGQIDEVALYNTALSSSQVLTHYTSAGVPPTIVLQPLDVTTNEGGTASFSVAAVGTAVTYQWFDPAFQPIPNATNTTLVLQNVQSSQGGYYYVEVKNAYTAAPVQSYYAALLVLQGPPILAVDLQPLDFIGYAGRSFSYSVNVNGTAPFSYQWYKNGSVIAGATGATYAFSTAVGTNQYQVAVTNSYSAGVPTWSSVATNIGLVSPTLDPNAYTYKMQISFAGYTNSEALTFFPALVTFGTNLSRFNYGQMADPAAGDLRFTDATGTNELPHEVDEWNPNGQSAVWVQVPKLASSNDCIWAYWGNPAATTPRAWSTNGEVWVPAFGAGAPFRAVYHLKEAALPFADSSLQYDAQDGIAPIPVPGLIGTSGAFYHSNCLSAGSVTNLGDQFTLSCWAYVSPDASDEQILWRNKITNGWNADGLQLFINQYQTTDRMLRLESGNGSAGTSAYSDTGAVSFGQWHLVSVTFDRLGGKARVFLDGVDITVAGHSGLQKDFTITNALTLGGTPGSTTFAFRGMLDEARAQTGTNTATRIWADYQTVANNSTFEAYGAVIGGPSTVTITCTVQSGNLVLSWGTAGNLQSATSLSGPWNTLASGVSTYTVTPSTAPGAVFYRVK